MIHSVLRRGLMFVLSSPSGAGKTTITRALLDMDSKLRMSVSYTTRMKRPGEIDGKDYHFVSQENFSSLLTNNAFLEHANVFNHAYGTPRDEVESFLNQGTDIVFDIDWQGTRQLKESCPHDVVTVFILPPSYESLHERLQKRAQDSEEVIQMRMAGARSEMKHWEEYDYIVINRVLHDSIGAVYNILRAERLKRHRRIDLKEFVNGLCGTNE
jgi:guanylate kinase